MKLTTIMILLLGLVLAGSNAFAATDGPSSHTDKNSNFAGDPIFMNYQGVAGDVNGDGCTAIQLESFQWGVGIASSTGATGGGGAGKVSVHDISITKMMDKSSPLLVQQALTGKSSPVKIDFCKKIAGKLLPYAEYKLTNVLISSYSVSSGGDRPTESLSLNFAKITFSFFDYGPDGTLTGSSSVSFDVFTNQVT